MPPSEDSVPYITKEPSCEVKEHSLTCSVCLELFSEPKVLPCCHTFCLKCLEKTARSTEKKGEITYVNRTAHDAQQSGGMKKSVYSVQKSNGMEKMACSKKRRGEMLCWENVVPSCSLSSEQQRFQDPKYDVVSEVGGMARDISTKRGEIVCPQCRETHAIPAGGLTELLTDFIASHEIEVKNVTATQNSRGTTLVRLCGECDESVRIDSYTAVIVSIISVVIAFKFTKSLNPFADTQQFLLKISMQQLYRHLKPNTVLSTRVSP